MEPCGAGLGPLWRVEVVGLIWGPSVEAGSPVGLTWGASVEADSPVGLIWGASGEADALWGCGGLC